MKILFLGTGAADYDERLIATLERVEDKSIRRSSACLINGELLIDCGPHTLGALKKFGCDVAAIKYLLITHTHADHFNPDNVQSLATCTAAPLQVFVREGAEAELAGAEVHFVTPYIPFRIGTYTVNPLTANHTRHPLHYDIEWEGKRLFYGPDGAWLLHDTVQAMRGREYDVMIFDATVGDSHRGDYRIGEHNTLDMIRLMRQSFSALKIDKPTTKSVLSHLAYTLHPRHETLVEECADDGFLVAYDGMTLEL